MTSTLLPPNPSVNSDRSSSRRKRKKKSDKESQNQAENLHNLIPWKSEAQQQIYTSKLVQALQQARQGALGGRTPPTKRVRDAAYRVLAATAKGRSRWSGAILTSQLKLKFLKKNSTVKRQRRLTTVITTGNIRSLKKSKVSVSRLKSKGLQAFQRKARLLGRLIPGCRKQPFQVVLEEAIDYIPALEMQIRAMSSLVERLSTSSSTQLVSSDGLSQPGSSHTPPPN